MWNPDRSLQAARSFLSFTSARALPPLLCVVRQKEREQQPEWRMFPFTGSPPAIRKITIGNHFVAPFKVVRRRFTRFCYHVGGSGVWILEWGGLKQSLPSPSGMQGWRCRCLVLPPAVHLKPGWPHGGGHLLRLDTHTLGCSFRKGSPLAEFLIEQFFKSMLT